MNQQGSFEKSLAVMSWKKGSSLFLEIWPLVKKHIPDESFRSEFTSKLVELFATSDMDPLDLTEVDPELDELLGHKTAENPHEESVRICIRNMKDGDPILRKTAAEAICYFVGCAGGALAQEAAKALSEAMHSDQTDEFLAHALKALRDLVWENNAKIDPNYIRPFLDSENSEIAERAQYVLSGLDR